MAIQHQSRFASFQHGTVAPSPLFNRIDEPMTKTSTGIANPAVIDLFGVVQKTGEVLLVMNEPRPWDGGHEQLHEMQEKFNAYASFILDGEMTEAHPELAGRTAPDPNCAAYTCRAKRPSDYCKRSTTNSNYKRLEWK